MKRSKASVFVRELTNAGSILYRVNCSSKISRIETHLGEGRISTRFFADVRDSRTNRFWTNEKGKKGKKKKKRKKGGKTKDYGKQLNSVWRHVQK